MFQLKFILLVSFRLICNIDSCWWSAKSVIYCRKSMTYKCTHNNEYNYSNPAGAIRACLNRTNKIHYDVYINDDASIILLEINYNQQSCWNVSTYLAANDGPYFIIWGSWSAGDVWVAVAEATRAVEVEACRSNSRTSHGGIMHWTAQSSWAYYAEQNTSKLKYIWLI